MNLAYFYPIVFWNTSNLIVESGAQYKGHNIFINNDENNEEDLSLDDNDSSNNSVYGKIANAIGKMQQCNIKILPPDINKSNYTYTPNIENNTIFYGLKGIVGIGDNLIYEIISNRPYNSLEDFLNKIKIDKDQMITLIKSGAFDSFGNRINVMDDYIKKIANTKKRLTLQNVNDLIKCDLLPKTLDFEKKVYNFNKYIRNFKDKQNKNIVLDQIAQDFYYQHFNIDLLNINSDNIITINETTWKKIYDKHMEKIKIFINNNQQSLLIKINQQIINDLKNKYAKGNINKWSMDSVSFYQQEHELAHVNFNKYNIDNFYTLPKEPEVDYSFISSKGEPINLYKIKKIAGTVIDKNKDKSTITLLTVDGVVTVKAYGVMQQYDKQISEIGEDGKKHIIQKSIFTRGNKIIVNGIKKDDLFIAKTYKNTNTHHFLLIEKINEDGTLEIKNNSNDIVL